MIADNRCETNSSIRAVTFLLAANAGCAHRSPQQQSGDSCGQMSRHPGVTSHAARLLLVTKHPERVGDYVTYICEQIVYMKEATAPKRRRLSG